ncbi:aminotransferase [Penicillium odoratum]|uniref:aminotransferase n=1 Tax=Penicillium odoratum TaxID=1167516 RepID=UPI002547B8B5|nr:aminotransferase [Penicillium odoratum]KAJ5769647.1 aminotransferase [Penicillium odoratum]
MGSQETETSNLNLGQGTYRDEEGNPWVLPSVNKARESLLAQGLQHEYLPILGFQSFREETAKIILGDLFKEQASTSLSHQITQDLISEPTWSNHHQIFQSLGFPCESFKYYNHDTKNLDVESYYSTLRQAEPNSVEILHACAHNPTGCDPSKEQWREIADLMKARQLFPLFDPAYLGFNSGNFAEDAFPIRLFIGEMKMEAGVCVSFAKNMGLYGERVGCVLVSANDKQVAVNTQSMLEMLERSEISNTPAFGARIASQLLENDELRHMWFQDMMTMSYRIRSMRVELYEKLVSFVTPFLQHFSVGCSCLQGPLGLGTI